MDELARVPERILIDCLRALDGGANSEDCLARYPTRADDLRGTLAMRAQLLTLRATAPSPTAFASGREALLARVVRPLASSHPGSMETQGRQARGLYLRPATRAAFAGALLFAMASCAIGVSATPVGEQARDALPDIPTIELPEQRAPYPFPEFNSGSPDVLPTEEPVENAPVEVVPSSDEPVQSLPDADASDIDDMSDDGGDISEPEPVEVPSPNDVWLPPVNANEDEPLLETPEPQESSVDDDAVKDDDKDERVDDADDAEDDDHAEDTDKQDSTDERGNGSNSQNNGNPHGESGENSASNSSNS